MGEGLTQPRSIGLVGGLGPGSTIYYYSALIGAFSKRQPAPALLITHAEIAIVRELMERGALQELAAYLASLIGSLRKAGARIIAITAIAPQMCAPQLTRMMDVPLLDPIECIRAELTRRQLRRVAIMGTRFVMRSKLYGRLKGVDIVEFPDEAFDFIHTNYTKIVTAGVVADSGADIEGLRLRARDIVRTQGAQAVLLAGTDLSIAFDEATCGFPALDCARLHVDAILAAAYDGSPDQSSGRRPAGHRSQWKGGVGVATKISPKMIKLLR